MSVSPKAFDEDIDRRWRLRRAQDELREVTANLEALDKVAKDVKHHRELAVMRRDMLLKTIRENQPV